MTAAFNFTRKTLPQKEGLGEKLAKKRIALGFEIKDIEKNIRIRSKYIEALENGNYDKLPPDVYVRGFIKIYANFLKLDPNKVIRAYEKERGIQENVKKANRSPVVKPIDVPKIIITPKRILASSATFLAAIIILYISWQVRILTAPPKLLITNPKDNITTNSDSVSIEGQTDAGASLFINDVEVGVDQDGSFQGKVSLQNGVNILKIRANNKLGKENDTTRTIVANISPTNTTTSQATGLELKLQIGPKSASVLVEVDGKRVTDQAVVMLAGVTQTYKANDKITITTNDGGSVRVTYNGQDFGLLGKAGEQAKRDFTKGMQIK